MMTDISEEEVRLFHRTSDLWKKHINTNCHVKLIGNLLELSLVSGEEILFQFQHEEHEIDYATSNIDIMKGKFISVYDDGDYTEISIEYGGGEDEHSLYDVRIYHPVIYAYLSNL